MKFPTKSFVHLKNTHCAVEQLRRERVQNDDDDETMGYLGLESEFQRTKKGKQL